MTSSLVGSEMCIRDRFREEGLDEELVALEEAEKAAMDNLFIAKPSSEAVSYTHLTLPTICSV
eukprot:63637-Prorocentrum_lima.AAC.1